jgi:RNA polymerase sigma-70 factor, ECF subfamily
VALRQEELTGLSGDVDLERDRALVERCQAGDSAAYGNLYARYNERLLRFCLRRLNDRHEAEDAAQEAFARAWKALPNFGGDRRFYPWLTVIAGNICTDILRRRSRSTPTEDLELSLYRPVGSVGDGACDEFLMAAVDGDLVHQALDRLSDRHRHVLDLREGAGLSYQQIADEAGVEIGTIETLLWRARQALKREFAVLSESKGALAGFLVGAGALVRRGFVRVATRNAALQTGSGGGSLRNAFAGVAVTSAAVAAAFVAPHALSGAHATAAPTRSATAASGAPAHGSDQSTAAGSTAATPTPSGTAGTGTGTSTPASAASGPLNTAVGAASGAVSSSGLGLPSLMPPAGGSPLGAATVTTPVQGLVQALGGQLAAGSQTLTQPITGAVPAVGAAVGGVVSGVSGLLSTVAGALPVPPSTLAPGATSAPTSVVPGLPAPGLGGGPREPASRCC